MNFLYRTFSCLYARQRKLIKDSGEAAVATVIYMAMGPMSFFMGLDMTVAYFTGSQEIFLQVGKWGILAAYLLLVLVHWKLFVSGGKADKLMNEYSRTGGHSVFATAMSYGYIFVPCIFVIAIGVISSMRRY
tara:strand:- start:36 stop:431 length:396 start_codon:yes stop_codon:yes gene_type:complete